MTSEQLNGITRAVVSLMVTLLVSWGLDDVTAGFVAGGLVMLVAALWSWWSNRPTALAMQLSKIPGVQVQIAPNAPAPLRKLATDPGVPGVSPK
jgi:hypothetical protein